MAFQQEGSTTFVLGEIARPFRFRVSVANSTLQIWLQDTETQDEWQTAKLYEDDYAYDVAIPNATMQDYAEYFAECLNADVVEANPMFERTLTEADGSGWRTLHLTLLAKFSTRSTSFDFEFGLTPVVRDDVHALTARVHNLEEEAKRMKEEIASLKHASAQSGEYVMLTTQAATEPSAETS